MVQNGTASAEARLGFSVHIEVQGLESDRWEIPLQNGWQCRPVVMMHHVKQLLCIFLMLWFGLQANLVQAHATQEAAHVLHATSEMAHDLDHDDHDGHCAGAHCHHGAAITQSNLNPGHLPVGIHLRAVEAALISRLLPAEIERPKWALAAQAVAGF